MEQVGFEPNQIVSSIHTAAFNHMKGTQATNSVFVPDACDAFKIYTLDWTPDQLEMFVGDDNNPFSQRILIWKKERHNWEGWYVPRSKLTSLLCSILTGLLIRTFLFFLILLLEAPGK